MLITFEENDTLEFLRSMIIMARCKLKNEVTIGLTDAIRIEKLINRLLNHEPYGVDLKNNEMVQT